MLRPVVGARVDHRRMSDGPDLDPSVVAAKWDEIAPGIDKMARRTADPNDFAISPGSWLSATIRRAVRTRFHTPLACASSQASTISRP
jgi:hypothetical protein